MSSLQDLCFLNTRASHQASSLTKKLEMYGGEVIEIPLISIKKPFDIEALKQAVKRLDSFHWLIFTSVNSVDFFFEVLKEENMDLKQLVHLKFAVVGSKTSQRLEDYGFKATLVPDVYDGNHLAKALTEVVEQGENVLFPRSSLSRDLLIKTLEKKEIAVTAPIVYQTVANKSQQTALNELIRYGKLDIIIFTSPSAVKSFFKQLDTSANFNNLDLIKFAVIGSVTANALEKAGVSKMILPDIFTVDSLVQAIIKDIREE